MSAFSDAIHKDLDAAKATIESLFDDAEAISETIVEDLIAAATALIKQAPAVLVQAAVSGATAALSAGGTVANMAETAETAALNTLVSVGKPILDGDVTALKVVIGAALTNAQTAATAQSEAVQATPIPAT